MMWNGARVVVEEINTGVRTTIAEGATYGRYIPTGHIVYTDADGTLEAVPYDLKNSRVAGSASLVESGVRTTYWGGAASFAIAETGTFAFIRGSSWVNHQLTWVDRAGTVVGQVGQPATIEGVEVSPDGRYAVTYVASNNADISLFDLASGGQQRLTFDPATEDNPIWSPDSRRVAYRKVISGRDHRIYVIDLSGQGQPDQLYADSQFVAPRSWSRDGKSLAVGGEDFLRVINLEDESAITVTDAVGVLSGRFSPDGRWLAYTSPETGVREVYVLSFPEMTGKQQVSTRGGRLPVWSADSGELFFVSADTLMVSAVTTGDNFSRSIPRPLFVSPDLLRRDLYGFAVSADGQRILYPAPNPDAPAREIHVVLNWFEELKAKVGN
jgi:tricorn protease-like protein